MILKDLSEAIGVSGDEGEVRAVVLDAIRGHVDSVEIDTIGNVLAFKQGTGQQRLRVMLAAHMDEIGLMVTGHDGDGFLHIATVGGIDARLLPGTCFVVGYERLPGVIGVKPVHLLQGNEGETALKIESLFLDIGAKSKEEARKLAPTGSYAAFSTKYRELGPTVTGKAFDDRVGCAMLVELLRGERFRFDFHAAFTVQEEVGLRGARVAAFSIHPDCAVTLEGTSADDLPKDKDVSPTAELGKGPAITIMDHSFIADRRLVQWLTATAEELAIPYQIKQPGIGGTDSGAIHQAREGVPSATVAVPCRYIHSPVGLLSLDDYNNTLGLVQESLSRITRRTLRRNQ